MTYFSFVSGQSPYFTLVLTNFECFLTALFQLTGYIDSFRDPEDDFLALDWKMTKDVSKNTRKSNEISEYYDHPHFASAVLLLSFDCFHNSSSFSSKTLTASSLVFHHVSDAGLTEILSSCCSLFADCHIKLLIKQTSY